MVSDGIRLLSISRCITSYLYSGLFFCASSTVKTSKKAYCPQGRKVNKPPRGKKIGKMRVLHRGAGNLIRQTVQGKRGLQPTKEERSVTWVSGK